MLRNTTIACLVNITHNCIENISLLSKKCPGIIQNEVTKDFVDKDKLADQRKIIEKVNELAEQVIPNLNNALKKGDTEKLRSELIKYFSKLAGIFELSLNFHEEHWAEAGNAYEQQKGVYLDAQRRIVLGCQDAIKIVNEDRNTKGALGDESEIASKIKESTKTLGALLGLKVKENKEDKIYNFIRTMPYVGEPPPPLVETKFALPPKKK